MADDNYIRNFSRMVKSKLNPGLKAYFEYSNEIWNWMFQQAGWVLNNASSPAITEQYVIDSLKAINPTAADHPEKDAFMMSRLFKILNEEFPAGAERARIVKVAAVQHGWTDNTRRILLFLKNRGYKIMPDVVSPGGYFNFTQADHEKWNAMPAASVTPDMILDAVNVDYPLNEQKWTDQTAAFATQFGVGYAVYEGGQHMQPWLQGDYAYNPSVWASQVHPKMFDMYMTNYTTHTKATVNCQLFMAFSYVGEKESKYGSWGHLEHYGQLNTDSIVQNAPKYNAILYSNIQKADSLISPVASCKTYLGDQVDVTLTTASAGASIYYSLDGKYPFTLKYTAPVRATSGTYIYSITSKVGYNHSVVKKSLVFDGTVTKYNLTVTGGSGGGSYAEASKVTVAAAAAASGKIFDKWTGDVTYLKNATDSVNEITMPTKNISITATYKDKPIALDALSATIKIFPNPACDQVTIAAEGMINGHLSLISSSGITVVEKTISSDVISLDISGLAKGFYLIRFVTENESVIKTLLIH